MEEAIEAGLGLHYHDLRLRPTTEDWILVGASLRARVEEVLGPDAAAVEQIGSSSVVGLLAKPIIDLAAAIADHHDVSRIQNRLESAGWIYRGDAGDEGGHVFVLEARPWYRVAHLHVVDVDGRQWRDYLRFRDLLRRSSDASRAYETLKLQLIEEGGSDRKSYTDGKSATVRSLLDEFGQAVTMMDRVTLSDDVVVLRPWNPADAKFLTTASQDPAIQRYNGPPPESLADAILIIQRIEACWRTFHAKGDPTGTAFAIVDAASGEPVGMCGIDNWSNTDVAQFGYWLAADARGRGLATRAVTLMTTWLFDLGAARVVLTIQSNNAASAAVARRAGFTCEGTLRAHGVWRGQRQDVDVFAVLPDEWT
ncbi:MAG: GNAT family N-acetyltransferase [Actinobacteria bacterium]|nr:GNAT family N-acetyltransferase [Actinomycetota bacterium]